MLTLACSVHNSYELSEREVCAIVFNDLNIRRLLRFLGIELALA